MATFEVRIEVDGLRTVDEHFDRLAHALETGAREGVVDAVNVLDRAVKDELSLTSHPLGTPTPSPPGSPPSLVTGNLRRSVRKIQTKRIARGVYEGGTGPTAVYARIHELGGVIHHPGHRERLKVLVKAGNGYEIHMPKRPYVKPSTERARTRAEQAFIDRVRRALI